jgi:hypothetical protein
MENSQFDALAKSVASAPSRRQVLRTLGGGGLLAGLGIAFGRASAPISVTAQEPPCTISFVGTVRLGPSAGQMLNGGTTPGELRGDLTFTPDDTGAIAQGQIQLPDGTMVPVVGQRNGRAINLRLALPNQQTLVAVGTAEQDLAMCQGAVDGLLTGPQLGDLGDWHGTLQRQASMTSTAVVTNQNQTNQPPPTYEPTYESTMMPTTETAPPMGTGTYVPSCPICQTPLSRGESTSACNPVADGTSCGGGPICCGGMCIDPFTDHANCGACGNACGPAQDCINKTCQARETLPIATTAGVFSCDAGQTACNGSCVNTSSDANNCGACGNVCPGGRACINGACVADHR